LGLTFCFFSTSVHNLGVVLDQKFTFSEHLNLLCRACSFTCGNCELGYFQGFSPKKKCLGCGRHKKWVDARLSQGHKRRPT